MYRIACPCYTHVHLGIIIHIHVYTCPAVGRLTTSAELEAEVEEDVLRSRFTTDVATLCSVAVGGASAGRESI